MLDTFIYEGIKSIFFNNTYQTIRNFMVTMLNVVIDLFKTDFIYTGVRLLFAVSIVFIMMGFIIKLTELAMTDMLSAETYIRECIHMVVAIAVLYTLPTLIPNLVSIGAQFFVKIDEVINTDEFNEIVESDSPTITFALKDTDLGDDAGNTEFPAYREVKSSIKAKYDVGIFPTPSGWYTGIMCILSLALNLIIPLIICFMLITPLMQIVVKGFFSALAITNMYNDFDRAQGIVFLKGFLSDCISFGVILMALKIGTLFEGQIIKYALSIITNGTETYTVTLNNLDQLFEIKVFSLILLSKVALIGTVGSAQSVVKEII